MQVGQPIRIGVILCMLGLAGCAGATPVSDFFDRKAEREVEQGVSSCKCGHIRADSSAAGGWARGVKTKGSATFAECAALCFGNNTPPQ